MTQNDLISSVAAESGATKKATRETLKLIVKKIVECLESGDQVLVSGLGRFSTKQRAKRTGSNPATGVPVEIPAKVIPTMSYIKEVKEKVAKIELA